MTQPRRSAPVRRPTPGGLASSPRDQVLARRRFALIGLGLAVPLTLIVAIVTGSVLLLVVNIVVGLAFAGYVAMLLAIKQSQQSPRAARPTLRQDDDVGVSPRR